MPLLRPALLGLLVATSSWSARAETTLWKIDAYHTNAMFKVKHLGISNVTGTITGADGKVVLDESDLTKSTIEVTLDVATLSTDNEKRDQHLKSPDFFDVAKFPKITFKSTKIEKSSDGYNVTGDLTMHGVTKSVVLALEEINGPTKNPAGSIERGTSASVKVNRKDFGLNWNKALEAGGVLVGDDVKISIDVEIIKAADQSSVQKH